jgi:hypothetical protein
MKSCRRVSLVVIASEAKQSRSRVRCPGLLRRYASRNDDVRERSGRNEKARLRGLKSLTEEKGQKEDWIYRVASSQPDGRAGFASVALL